MRKNRFSEENIQVTVSTYRWAFVAAGAVAVVIGALLLFQTDAFKEIVGLLAGIYALAAGAMYGLMAVRGEDLSPGIRASRALVGITLIVGGILILIYRDTAVQVIVTVVGIAVGILWLFEGISAFRTLQKIGQNTWLTIYAAVALVAGIIMLLTPVWGMTVMAWLLGLSLIGLGITQIVRGLKATPAVVVDVEAESGA